MVRSPEPDPQRPGEAGTPGEPAEGESLEGEEFLDVEEMTDLDDEEDDDEEEEGDEETEDEAKPDAEKEEGPAKPAKSAKKDEEEEPPGPDVPAPSRDKMRAALDWAFDGLEVTEELLDLYTEHALMMLDANRRVNLTAILDPKEVAAKHYLDSWRVTQMISLVGRRVVDLGCGPGFPGLPLAMAEKHTSVCCVDSTRKKIDFLQKCIDDLGVKNATAHWGRAEEYLLTERCDVVVVRAVSSVRENVRTLRKVRHSLKDLVMLKGNSWSREVRASEREAERLGFTLDTVWEHELPEEMGKRGILIYRAPGGQGR
jgi:16S rRNA (guanine527-N7)-methyltransferase